MKIIINTIPPTINKYIGRTNIWEYQKDKREIHRIVKLQTLGKKPMISKCTMKITYYFKDRRKHDPSNYDKFLLDALVEANIITDDNYDVIRELTTTGKCDRENPRVEIEISNEDYNYDYCSKRQCNGCKSEQECSNSDKE